MLAILASSSDQRSIENELVLALGFEQFELIKELIKNRLRIVWCTRLSRAQVGAGGDCMGMEGVPGIKASLALSASWNQAHSSSVSGTCPLTSFRLPTVHRTTLSATALR